MHGYMPAKPCFNNLFFTIITYIISFLITTALAQIQNAVYILPNPVSYCYIDHYYSFKLKNCLLINFIQYSYLHTGSCIYDFVFGACSRNKSSKGTIQWEEGNPVAARCMGHSAVQVNGIIYVTVSAKTGHVRNFTSGRN